MDLHFKVAGSKPTLPDPEYHLSVAEIFYFQGIAYPSREGRELGSGRWCLVINGPFPDFQGTPSILFQTFLLCSLLLISCNAINHGRFSCKQWCFHVSTHWFLLKYAKGKGTYEGIMQAHEERGELPPWNCSAVRSSEAWQIHGSLG